MEENKQLEPLLCDSQTCRKAIPAERLLSMTGRQRIARYQYCSARCSERAKTERWRAKDNNQEKQNAAMRAHRLKHPKKAILARSKNNAKKDDRTHTLTERDIPDIPEFCPIFPWIKLVFRAGTTGRGKAVPDDAPSLDCIYPERGYVPGNVRIISMRANLLKRDAKNIELVALGKDGASRLTHVEEETFDDLLQAISTPNLNKSE